MLRNTQFKLAAIILAAVTLFAANESQAKEGLKNAFGGKTVYLNTPVGAMPIRYSKNGTMTGRAKSYLASYVGSTKDRGSWWVSGNKICHRWNKWLDRKSFCFTVKKVGQKVYWHSNTGHSGTATIAH